MAVVSAPMVKLFLLMVFKGRFIFGKVQIIRYHCIDLFINDALILRRCGFEKKHQARKLEKIGSQR